MITSLLNYQLAMPVLNFESQGSYPRQTISYQKPRRKVDFIVINAFTGVILVFNIFITSCTNACLPESVRYMCNLYQTPKLFGFTQYKCGTSMLTNGCESDSISSNSQHSVLLFDILFALFYFIRLCKSEGDLSDCRIVKVGQSGQSCAETNFLLYDELCLCPPISF